MDCVVATVPRDAEQRRRLWREWIHMDAPVATRAVPVARRADAPSPNVDWLPVAIDAPPAVIAGLTAAIRAALVDDRLPYGDRSRLIARAGRLGLNRFEANLLVAAVVNQAGAVRSDEPKKSVRSARRRWGVLSITAAVIAGEAALVAAVFLSWSVPVSS